MYMQVGHTYIGRPSLAKPCAYIVSKGHIVVKGTREIALFLLAVCFSQNLSCILLWLHLRKVGCRCLKWRGCTFCLIFHANVAKAILLLHLGKKTTIFIVFCPYFFSVTKPGNFQPKMAQLKMQPCKGSYAEEQKPAGVKWEQRECCKVSLASKMPPKCTCAI